MNYEHHEQTYEQSIRLTLGNSMSKRNSGWKPIIRRSSQTMLHGQSWARWSLNSILRHFCDQWCHRHGFTVDAIRVVCHARLCVRSQTWFSALVQYSLFDTASNTFWVSAYMFVILREDLYLVGNATFLLGNLLCMLRYCMIDNEVMPKPICCHLDSLRINTSEYQHAYYWYPTLHAYGAGASYWLFNGARREEKAW